MLNAEIVGQVIQRKREQKKLSQEVISGLAGIGRTHLSAIERGERKPTLETFFKIAEALKLFASPDVPVLIIVYHVGDIIDYDAPTTAEKYLNYIKDQKKVAVGIYNIKYDSNNKITELELIKK